MAGDDTSAVGKQTVLNFYRSSLTVLLARRIRPLRVSRSPQPPSNPEPIDFATLEANPVGQITTWVCAITAQSDAHHRAARISAMTAQFDAAAEMN